MLKYTIISIVKNDPTGIRKTSESVLSQLFNDYEYIIIDGSSTDSTLEIIEEIQHSNYKYISEADSGIYNAMNKGLKMASGEYIIFLNAGDYFPEANTLSEIDRHYDKADILYGNLIFNKEEKLYSIRHYPEPLSTLFWLCDSIPHPGTAVRSSLLNDGFDESFKIAADYNFFLWAQYQAKAIFKHTFTDQAVFDMSGISKAKEFEKLQEDERNRAQKEQIPKDEFKKNVNFSYLYNIFVKKPAYLQARINALLIKSR